MDSVFVILPLSDFTWMLQMETGIESSTSIGHVMFKPSVDWHEDLKPYRQFDMNVAR